MLFQLGIDTIAGPDAHWDVMIKTAHLYEECRRYGDENGIKLLWLDMETFMREFDKDSLGAKFAPREYL
ncbi:hypothetical protein GGF32_005913 [Allomyces javanicus]|nr:hypothetical protein GGF32_005913 [Allomyces javanicus]